MDELQQLLCAANWIRTAVPDYFRLVEHHHKLVEAVYKTADKQTKKSVSKINIMDQWGLTNLKYSMILKQFTQVINHPI